MSYTIVFIPFIALLLTQVIKVIIDSLKGKFAWQKFNSYGGMPSSHSAMVAALATEAGLQAGFNSVFFAISLTFAFLIIRDAVGIRQQAGKHAQLINQLVKDLPDKAEDKYPLLEERLGHTFLQVSVGLFIGIVIAIII